MLPSELQTAHMQQLVAILRGEMPLTAIASADWQWLIPLAVDHGVFGWVCHIADDAVLDTLPRIAQSEIRAWRKQLAIEAIAQQTTMLQIQQLLDAQAIPCIWLKGSMLRYEVYPFAWARRMMDVDVLVPRQHVATVCELLQAAHYRVDIGELDMMLRPASMNYLHHIEFRSPKGVSVEVHHRLMAMQHGILPVDWGWDVTKSYVVAGHTLRGLAPVAMLFHLALHDLIHHQKDAVQLSRKFDLHLLVTQCTINWDELLEIAESLQLATIVEQALLQSQRLFDTVIPSVVLEQLASFDDATHFVPAQLQRWQHLQTMSSWRQRLAYLWYSAFPPKSHLIRHDHIAADDIHFGTYLHRIWRKLRQMFDAVRQQYSLKESDTK